MKAISTLLLLVACSTYEDPQSIEQSFHQKQWQFDQCYYESDLYLKKSPGSADIHFIINSDGKVMNPKIINSDFKDPNLNACLLMVVKQMNFHHHFHNQEYTQSFNFTPVRK
ncbi:MAG: AgmX/PglI C-terminal domain-containing protein [Bacteriovoracaceae bacterium]